MRGEEGNVHSEMKLLNVKTGGKKRNHWVFKVCG